MLLVNMAEVRGSIAAGIELKPCRWVKANTYNAIVFAKKQLYLTDGPVMVLCPKLRGAQDHGQYIATVSKGLSQGP